MQKNVSVKTAVFTYAIALLAIIYGAGYLIRRLHPDYFPYYAHLFSYLPQHLVIIRFSASILMRVVVIAAGFGMLFRCNWARLVAAGYCCFSILTLYFRHPYMTIDRVYTDLVVTGYITQAYLDANAWFVPVTLAVVWIIDAFFYIVILAFLMQRDVKEYFR